MKLDRRVLWTCLALYGIAQILFLIQIGTPLKFSFDEFHYVPSAKQYLDWVKNQNWEHPPLGKMLMAIGIGAFGDEPFGWRFMSTVFGSLTLVGMYLWALALFRSRTTALWFAFLTFVNHLLYVQARIGMLDTFMFAFIVWGLAAFTATWDDRLQRKQVKRMLAFMGCMFGLATATKWYGLMPWFACGALVAGVRLLQFRNYELPRATEEDWYRPDLWKSVSLWDWVRYLLIYPVLLYSVCFIPRLLIEYSGPWYAAPLEFLKMQVRMWEGQLRVVTNHPYMSEWWQWPLMNRPIWYAFEHEGRFARGVVLLGNPLVMWTGLLALAACIWEWFRYRSYDAFLVVFFYLALYWSWIFIPRKVSFYYYYYPAGMALGLALAYVFHHGERGPFFKHPWARWVYLGAATLIFIYFLPILTGTPILSQELSKWMWFRVWI